MQEKTINNALIALATQGGSQAKLADVLLEMRGVEWSGIVQDNPFRRGCTRQAVLTALKQRPMTTYALGDVIRLQKPDVGPRAAANSAYQALRRLLDKGLVKRNGRLWSLA